MLFYFIGYGTCLPINKVCIYLLLFIHSFIHLLIDWLIYLFIHLFIHLCARSQYWAMLGRLGFSLFQLKLSIIYTDNFCSVSLSYVERDNKKRKQNMLPFDFFVIDHFVANFDQKMLEKRDIKKTIFSMALGRTYAWISILFSVTDTFRIN